MASAGDTVMRSTCSTSARSFGSAGSSSPTRRSSAPCERCHSASCALPCQRATVRAKPCSRAGSITCGDS
ncbi:hypothetical protein ACFPRL_26690 [Pseudoclavibacter helvolus]